MRTAEDYPGDAYCATPSPNDQFSFFTSTRLTMTFAARTKPPASMEAAMRLNSAFFVSSAVPFNQ
jgi:hypothetical protein